MFTALTFLRTSYNDQDGVTATVLTATTTPTTTNVGKNNNHHNHSSTHAMAQQYLATTVSNTTRADKIVASLKYFTTGERFADTNTTLEQNNNNNILSSVPAVSMVHQNQQSRDDTTAMSGHMLQTDDSNSSVLVLHHATTTINTSSSRSGPSEIQSLTNTAENENNNKNNNTTSRLDVDNITMSIDSAVQDQGLPPIVDWLLKDESQGFSNIQNISSHPPHSNTFQGESTMVIPKVIYKTFYSQDGRTPDLELVSKPIQNAINSWILKNPGYILKLFGLNDSRAYLEKYFHPVFLRAFDCLQAYASKSDFFRAAVLYREGGWYSDWKEECLFDGLLEYLVNVHGIGKDHRYNSIVYAWDRGTPTGRKNYYVMTAFIGAAPGSPMLAEVLRLILLNIQNTFYGEAPVDPTGPRVYGEAYRNVYNDPTMREKFPFATGKYQWNKYWFGKRGKDAVKIYHKCLSCFVNPVDWGEQDWDGLGGNDYRVLYKNHQFYCSTAETIFQSNDQQSEVANNH